jgi:hypothetical protein
MAPDSKYIEQPKDHHDHDHDIKDLFDLTIHRDVGVHEPQQDPDNDEGDDDCN